MSNNQVPVFLINFNLLTWTKNMCQEISRMDGLYPVIVDNGSFYPPLLEWFENCPYEVIRLEKNYNQMVVWHLGLHLGYDSDEYIVSDPDLDLSGVPDDCLDYLRRGRQIHPHCRKIGLGITIDDLPDDSPVKANAIGWETPFWANPDGNGYYFAPVDTTFALYRKSTDNRDFMSCMRCDKPYTVKHLPFYLTPDTIDEELAFYLKTADNGIATMPRYLKCLVEHYERVNGQVV